MQYPATHYLSLTPNRKISYCQYGQQDGIPVFYAHGGPGSRLEGIFFQEAAKENGFRLICMDRPGMGESTFVPNRKLLDYPQDVAALADHLHIEQFGLIGFSGGGAYTLACAYALSNRLLFCISCAGYTNFGELPNAADYLRSKADRLAVKLARKKSLFFQCFFYLFYLSVHYTPRAFLQAFKKSIAPIDQQALADPMVQQQFIKDQQEGLRQKSKGVALDAAIHYQDWGFLLREINTKVIIFHGTEDWLVPLAYAKHLAQELPLANLQVLEGKGHLLAVEIQDLIFETAQLACQP